MEILDKSRKSISEIAAEALILILQLRSTSDYGEAESLKNHIIDLFDAMEKKGRVSGIDNDKIRLAKFALAAFIDETIVSSSWIEKDIWITDPLQLKLFGSFNAGEEFFTYLHDLRRKSASNRDVLELYYLCLVLGFNGKYQLQSPETLRRIIEDLNMELHPETYSADDAISPNAKPKETLIQAARSRIPIWIYPAAALIIFFIVYFFMSNSISEEPSETTQFIKNLTV